jgi:hypothetical protein
MSDMRVRSSTLSLWLIAGISGAPSDLPYDAQLSLRQQQVSSVPFNAQIGLLQEKIAACGEELKVAPGPPGEKCDDFVLYKDLLFSGDILLYVDKHIQNGDINEDNYMDVFPVVVEFSRVINEAAKRSPYN